MTEQLLLTACPPVDDLLLTGEGELSARQEAALVAHVKACGNCRDSLQDVNTFLIAATCATDDRDQAEARARRERFLLRLHEQKQARIHRVAGNPIRRWLPVAAALIPILITAFLFSRSQSTVVHAEELLAKAAAVERAHSTVTQRVRLRLTHSAGRTGKVTPKTSVWIADVDEVLIPGGHEHLLPDELIRYGFDKPLSVAPVRVWRASLNQKRDRVYQDGADTLVLVTTTDEGTLRQVEIAIHRINYQVFRQKLVLADGRRIEFEEISRSPAAPGTIASRSVPATATPAVSAPAVAPAPRPVVLRQSTTPKVQPSDLSRWLDRRFGERSERGRFVPRLTERLTGVHQRLVLLQNLAEKYPEASLSSMSIQDRADLERLLPLHYRKLHEHLDEVDIRLKMLLGVPLREVHSQQPPLDWRRRVTIALQQMAVLRPLVDRILLYEDVPDSPDETFRTARKAYEVLWNAVNGGPLP